MSTPVCGTSVGPRSDRCMPLTRTKPQPIWKQYSWQICKCHQWTIYPVMPSGTCVITKPSVHNSYDLLHGWPTNVIGNVNKRVRGQQCVDCIMYSVWDQFQILLIFVVTGDRHCRQYEMETFSLEHILPLKLIVGEVGKKSISSLTLWHFLCWFPKTPSILYTLLTHYSNLIRVQKIEFIGR